MVAFFSDWDINDLKDFKKKLEEMYLQGVRQSTFKDQTLIFGSTSELEQRIRKVCDAINDLEIESGSGKKAKKQVRISTKNKGFI